MAGRKEGLPPELVNAVLRAVQNGALPAVSSLAQSYQIQQADILMCSNKHGDTPFLVAARHGHVSLLREMHVHHGVSLQHTNSDGKTALHEAAQNGQIEAIGYLVEGGSDVDSLKRADW